MQEGRPTAGSRFFQSAIEFSVHDADIKRITRQSDGIIDLLSRKLFTDISLRKE
jgi:hypothetical protein